VNNPTLAGQWKKELEEKKLHKAQLKRELESLSPT
jgi:hypothetical protein